MCGIAGVLGHSEGQVATAEAVAAMLAAQAHRGPDDAGIWTDGRVALGNCRLAILDLSPAGHQPMVSADGSLVVVQNGEIYNFEVLKRELQAAGAVFASDSDTEVLLHAYARWGLAFVSRLRGMFAIALWDRRLNRLLLARDRFGIKPLHYRLEHGGGGVRTMFASEIKAILAVQSAVREPNEAIVYDFLAHGVLEHRDDTFFQGIRKVPAAHYCLVTPDGRIDLQRYWDIEINDEIGERTPGADREAADAFREAFIDSVRHHLVSDVPVGTCLSGGLDSSSVVCTVEHLRRHRDARTPLTGRQQTFTISYDDPHCDEWPRARIVVEATGAESVKVMPTASGAAGDLALMLHHQEEPVAGLGVYAQFCLMRAIHEASLKVVLSGQGGDEQLLGYGKFYLFYLMLLAHRRRYGALFVEGAQLLHSGLWRHLDLRHGVRYMGRFATLSGEAEFVNPGLRARFSDHAAQLGFSGSLGDRIRLDMAKFSLPLLLRYEDRNSMAFSVESRVPFVDHVLAEHIARLPFNQKLRNGWTKFVLRQSLRGILPDAIRLQKRKMGFDMPETRWYWNELRPYFEAAFDRPAYLTAWANVARLREAFASYHRTPRVMSPHIFWRYVVVEHWARHFFSQPTNAWPRADRGRVRVEVAAA